MNKYWFLIVLALVAAVDSRGQTQQARHLVDWVAVREGEGSYQERLRKQLDRITDFFVRVTSPDVARDARRLWIVSAGGKSKCLVSPEAGVSEPRWGSGGYIVYLMEADTNGDGSVDYRDDYLIRAVQPSGRGLRLLGQGRSAVWSPDGRNVAILRNGAIFVATLTGEVVPLGPGAPPGKFIVTNSLASPRTRSFWAVDARTSAAEPLPAELREKYLWLGALSPSGGYLVFPNEMKTDLFVRRTAGGEQDLNITNDRFTDMDPSWSPDGSSIVYVSDSPLSGPLCSATMK
jgi:dipeptidyl aminopeptidase/acylaminoacyl peptidase